MPCDLAKFKYVSPAIAVAKELHAGEMPACVSVSVSGSVVDAGALAVLISVVDMFAPVIEGTVPLLDPAPTQ